MPKIKIPMGKHEWLAIERTLWICIRNGRDDVIRETLIQAYDKKKMIFVDAEKNKHWSLDVITASMVASQVEWFLLMADKMETDIADFAVEFQKNLNGIKNSIRQQTVRYYDTHRSIN